MSVLYEDISFVHIFVEVCNEKNWIYYWMNLWFVCVLLQLISESGMVATKYKTTLPHFRFNAPVHSKEMFVIILSLCVYNFLVWKFDLRNCPRLVTVDFYYFVVGVSSKAYLEVYFPEVFTVFCIKVIRCCILYVHSLYWWLFLMKLKIYWWSGSGMTLSP